MSGHCNICGKFGCVESLHPAKGETWQDSLGWVRVMAVAERYVMARRPGSIPFVRYSTAFVEQFSFVKQAKGGA